MKRKTLELAEMARMIFGISAETGIIWILSLRILNHARVSFNGDGDVDGGDLASFIQNNQGMSLMNFSENFGKNNCPIILPLAKGVVTYRLADSIIPYENINRLFNFRAPDMS
ncbi:MAG: hypothetical protein U5R30_15305 [Deltaproteobacteria bacterium]|nr:hypothetical protein [Deltaproteobacteria bacterium]